MTLRSGPLLLAAQRPGIPACPVRYRWYSRRSCRCQPLQHQGASQGAKPLQTPEILYCWVAASDERCGKHRVQGYDQDKLAEAVRGCDLVIIPAGVPRKPGMTRDDLFKVSTPYREARGVDVSEVLCCSP
jgi:hypothetical protein